MLVRSLICRKLWVISLAKQCVQRNVSSTHPKKRYDEKEKMFLSGSEYIRGLWMDEK